MSASLPTRIQGTDGIRGKVALDDELNGNCLERFLVDGVLTPSFFELYCYAYAKLVMERYEIPANNNNTNTNTNTTTKNHVVVGWDPRDTHHIFNQKAIDGIRKAGLDVWIVGILPTPAIPLYSLYTRAAGGGVMLTASHNPSDQNGIKVFHAHTGLKFLPGDDVLLTSMIGAVVDDTGTSLKDLPLLGRTVQKSSPASDLFVEFCCSPENSWMEKDDTDTIVKSLKTITLVVDGSNGAASTVANKIFSQFAFHEIVLTNVSVKLPVNENCGVADIEGRDVIYPHEVFNSSEGSNDAAFCKYDTLRRMFEVGREQKANKVIGIVFDGDADRCFRLDYHPTKDVVLVSGGDKLGYIQAASLVTATPTSTNDSNQKTLAAKPEPKPLFVNTVESDMSVSINANANLGYDTQITGVGDKWILTRAFLSLIQMEINFSTTDTDPQKLSSEEASAILNLAKHIQNDSSSSALELSKLWGAAVTNGKINRCTDPTRCIFRVGFEESGHFITPALLKQPDDATNTNTSNIVFMGNGLKTALNSIVSTEKLFGHLNQADYYQQIERPFAEGYTKTYYVYYVDKSRLELGHAVRQDIARVFYETMATAFGDNYRGVEVPFPEESSMQYFRIEHKGDENDAFTAVGAVFMRNSGTEDKSALYLRGQEGIKERLLSLGAVLRQLLFRQLKDRSKIYAKFEKQILCQIWDGSHSETAGVGDGVADIPVSRIMKEMELKQGLIRGPEGQKELTEFGKSVI